MPRLLARNFLGAVRRPLTGGSVSAADAAALKPAALTVEAWVFVGNFPASQFNVIASKTSSSSWADGYGFYYRGGAVASGGVLSFWVNSSATGDASTAAGFLRAYVNQWIHVVGTYDGAAVRLYVNGAQVASRTYSTAITHSTHTLTVGDDGFGEASDVQTTAVRVYGRALSAQDVADRYFLGRDDAAMRTGLALQWDFSELFGTSVADSSGSGNTGTLSSASLWVVDVPMRARLVGRHYPSSLFIPTADVGSAYAVAGTAIPPTADGPASIEGWFFLPGSSVPSAIVGMVTGGLGFGMISVATTLGDQTLTAFYQSSEGANTTYTVPNFLRFNQWIHLAMVLDGTGLILLYRNGQLINRSIRAYNLTAGSTKLYTGAIASVRNGTPNMKAADVRAYTRALSAQDVADRYILNRNDAAMRTTLAAQYLFSEGSGTAAADSSGNGRNLTLVSANDWSSDSPMKSRAATPLATNLLPWSEDFSNAAWVKTTGVTVTANSTDVAAPWVGAQVNKVVYDGSGSAAGLRLYTDQAPKPAGPFYTMALWLRTASGSFTLRLQNNLGNKVITVDTTWRQFFVSAKWSLLANIQLILTSAVGDNAAFTLYATAAQAAAGDGVSPYLKTTSVAIDNGAPRVLTPQAQSLVVRSDEPNLSPWIATNITVTAGQTLAPDGTMSGAKIAETAATGAHVLQQVAVTADGRTAFTLSAFLQQGPDRYAQLRVGTSAGYEATFDLQAGTVTNVGAGVTATIQADPRVAGWYRCAITFTPASGTMTLQIAPSSIPGAYQFSYTGDPTRFVYVWRAQLVQANWAGPPQATAGVVVNNGPIRSVSL